MQQPTDTSWQFDEIVDALEVRARHLLGHQDRIGSTIPLTGKARIADDELRVRFTRLRSELETLRRALVDFVKHRPDFVNGENLLPWMVSIETALQTRLFSELREDEVETRIRKVLTGLDAILSELHAAERLATELTEPALLQLTPEEISSYTDAASNDAPEEMLSSLYPPEIIEWIIALVRVQDTARRCASETKAILAGRFQYSEGPGRPEKLRGGRLAAELLGFAMGLGLKATRGSNSPPQSGADAVIAALNRCKDVNSEAARTILGETPPTFHTFAKYIFPKCREGEILFEYWDLGRILGERMRHRT